jgi:N-methylhydantoinase B/oxoprolinase/acetone carboxylase alpha subunit
MSTLSVSNITDGTTTVGTEYVVNGSAKAWWHLDSAANALDTFNVSGTVDVSTGRFQVNFTSSMSNSYSSANAVARTATAACYPTTIFNLSATDVTSQTYRSINDTYTYRYVMGSVSGDLA